MDPRRLVHELKPGAARSMLQTAAVCKADERAREAIWSKLLGTLGPVAGVGALGIGSAVLGSSSNAAASTTLAPSAATSGVVSASGVVGSTLGVITAPGVVTPVLGAAASVANTAVWVVALKSALLSTVVSLASYSAFSAVAPKLLDPLETHSKVTASAPVGIAASDMGAFEAHGAEVPTAASNSESREIKAESVAIADLTQDTGPLLAMSLQRPGMAQASAALAGRPATVSDASPSDASLSKVEAEIVPTEIVLEEQAEAPASGVGTSAVARFETLAPPVAEPPADDKEDEAGLHEEQRLLKTAGVALRAGRVPQAMELLRAAQRRFPNGNLTQPREALLVEALVRSGQAEEARARAERFVRAFPKSRLAARVQRLAQLKDPLIYWPFWWNR